jgi:hypothetical protein
VSSPLPLWRSSVQLSCAKSSATLSRSRHATSPLNYGRKPHRRLRRRGHPPPCRGPAAIGPRRRNSPHPCDPHPPPMLRHRFPVAKPDRRRRTAAELAADRPRSSPFSPSVAVNAVSPPSLPGWWAHATAPSLPRSWAASAPRAHAPSGPKSPPLAQLAGEFLLFFFSYFFFSFSHIYLDANILCTKNCLNKLLGHKNNKV